MAEMDFSISSILPLQRLFFQISTRRRSYYQRYYQLAMTQTHFVVDSLKKYEVAVEFNIVSMSTTGDHILDQPLSQIGEKSLFTKELEIALEKNQVDFVVHSLKDLPTTLPEGMVIAAILEREDPRDSVVVSSRHSYKSLAELPKGSIVGTSSLRRCAQLFQKYPNIVIKDVRGNLNTRLRKLDSEDCQYDALVLAAAGVKRMGWQDRITEILNPSTCMYAIGQGALAIECREGDKATIELLSRLFHVETAVRCVAERAFLRKLEGGCSVPVAVSSSLDGSTLHLEGGVFSLDGSQFVIDHASVDLPCLQGESVNSTATNVGVVSSVANPDIMILAEDLGRGLAETLVERGAMDILRKARAETDAKKGAEKVILAH